MSLTSAAVLHDVQAEPDTRGVALDEVGVSGVHLPAMVMGRNGGRQSTVVTADLTVRVPHEERGTHMSRFIEAALNCEAFGPASAIKLAQRIRGALDATDSRVELRFPLFVERRAPESGLVAPHKFDAWLRATSSASRGDELWVGVRAAVTSLCPCSKEISDYGAHSQRGYVEAEVLSPDWALGRDGVHPHDLLGHAEAAGSAQIYPLLKRVDERHVTMAAYDNPAFVEDIARDVVLAIQADMRCAAWQVYVSNQESIHDHQAVARVRGRR